MSGGRPRIRRETLDDLAVFGGSPAFPVPVHVGRPNVGDRRYLFGRMVEALDRHWLTNNGPLVREFEKRVAEITEVEHCVAVSNATVGIQLLARALNITGDVLVPAFSFVATAHALSWIGLKPIFCDLDRQTHGLDARALKHALTPRTSGILGVHVWGRPCDIEGLTAFARARGLALIFDAAHAFGCSSGGRAIGGFGAAEVFSFHATKIVNAAEGGAITTNDAELAERLRLMRNFGFTDYDTVGSLGTNGKMSELNAAMGLTSLDAMDEFVAAARRNYLHYTEQLEDVVGVRLINYDERERHNFHYVVIEVLDDASGVKWRDELVAALHAENVLARRYFYPGCHRVEPYCRADGAPATALPATDQVASRVVVLPTGTSVDAGDVETICSIIRAAAKAPEELRERLGSSMAS